MCFFFFNDTATTEIYTLSLHDALPISRPLIGRARGRMLEEQRRPTEEQRHADDEDGGEDRKSTRLNSSHGYISYAVFCLKKKKHDVPRLASHHQGHAPILVQRQSGTLR